MGQFNKLWVVRNMETCDGNLFSASARWVTQVCGLKKINPGRRGHRIVTSEGGRSIPASHLNSLKVSNSHSSPRESQPVSPRALAGWAGDHLVMGPWAGGGDTYLRRQAIADRVHVVGGRCRVHEALGVAGEAVASSVSRAGVCSCSGRSQAPLVHGGRREGLGPVHGAASICGETQERA